MKTWKHMWRRLKQAFVGTPPRVIRPRKVRVGNRLSPRNYPAVLGGTACDILRHLSARPMTRYELNAALAPITTAGQHLPRLHDRGLISAVKHGRTLYSITDKGVEALQVAMKQP